MTANNVPGVYEKAGSPGAGLLIWGLAGIIATLCTLAYAELGKKNNHLVVLSYLNLN